MSSGNYIVHSARTINVGLVGTDNVEILHSFLNENVLDAVKICPNFELKTYILPAENPIYCQCNFIFYVTTLDKISEDHVLEEIKKIALEMNDPRNHLFVVVDHCYDLEIDEDGDISFTDTKERKIFNKFNESLSSAIDDKLFHLSPISIEMAIIWKIISDENSISNLSEDQINKLASVLVKKSSKMSFSDKKRELKSSLKKINDEEKLADTGYNEFFDNVVQYFKLVQQKKIIYQNYIYCFKQIVHDLGSTGIQNLNNLLKEIYTISYLKSEMHDDLIDKIEDILLSNLKQYYEKNRNNVSIDSKPNHINAYTYHQFLFELKEMVKGYNLSGILEITNQEIELVNNLITEHHKKELERVTDLDKISSYLEIFADKDKDKMISLFDNISSQTKILQENIEKMDKWVIFINRCLKMGIPNDSIIKLVEEIISVKILYYTDISRLNNKNLNAIYPQCLNVFLLSNLEKHFVFKKMYMVCSYNIRYAGRNIMDHIKILTADQFQKMMVLENKLLELCSSPYEEPSQQINLSEINIVETFNEPLPHHKTKKLKRKIIVDVDDQLEENNESKASDEKVEQSDGRLSVKDVVKTTEKIISEKNKNPSVKKIKEV